MNNNLPKYIDDLLEIDKADGCFKTLYGQKFLIYNDEDVIVLQSDIQAKIMLKNYEDIFLDGTFFSDPKCIYQILIIRVNLKHSNKYATTGFALCKNKTEKLYRLIIYEINKNLNAIGGKIFKPNNIHIDFEIALSNAIINIWNYCQIRYCLFHFQQIIERKRKKFIYLQQRNRS